MLRRIILKVTLMIDSPQIKYLVRTQGRDYGRFCKIIVGSKLMENFVSIKMAEICKLKRLSHVAPHKIFW